MEKDSDQRQIEEKIYKGWEDKGYFTADPNSSKKPYSLLMPPPNLTGELHLGHAMEHSVLDAIARFKRMQGFDVLLLPGVDHAGIQLEGTLDRLLTKEDLSKKKLGREEWLKRAWKFEKENYESFHETWKLMGISADWSREVFTMDPKVEKAVFTEFKTFWDQDLLYKGAYIIQWCSKCGTAIEDIEMEYQEREGKLYFVKYQIKDSDDFISVGTVRPETVFADVAIAVHPNDSRYNKIVGKTVINPLTNKEMPIISDKRVDKNFGTGALKITPGHDFLDFEIGKDHNLPILHAIDKSGRMTDLAEGFVGQKAEEARENVYHTLMLKNRAGYWDVEQKKELCSAELTHSLPVCERCKTVVEPLISEEWFVKMKPLAEKALKHLDEINFLPKNYKKVIADWYREIHDWSISRSLWWGHRIPVWYCEKCNPSYEVGKDKDMVISLEKPTQKCKTCNLNNWVQDEQVLDTWFSSGLWPIATLGWGLGDCGQKSEDRNEWRVMQRYFPWDFDTSAPEIKYLWIARMIMLGLWFVDKIPFKNHFFHGMLRDLQGRKFSKSLGNGIDPYDLVKVWGVDQVRMVLYTYSAPGRDARTSRQVMDQRCKNFRNFGTKINNIARFVYELRPENEGKLEIYDLRFKNEEDREILEKLNKTIKDVTKNLEAFNLHLAIEEIYDFVWHEFADIYIEKSKKRRIEAQPILEKVFGEIVKILHPFMPFLTEELYQKYIAETESIILEEWPE